LVTFTIIAAHISRADNVLGNDRSHRSDKDEFYQLLTYRDDVDLEKKLAVWERFYNFDRPHGAHGGKTPYEALREKLS
jgi:transposase InsO family protein